jgi:hypothetical protein
MEVMDTVAGSRILQSRFQFGLLAVPLGSLSLAPTKRRYPGSR